MSAIHRVYAQSRAATSEGVVCPRCQRRNQVGREQCEACQGKLFRQARPGLRAAGEFSERVTHGEDMPAVTGYLRAHGYAIGPAPETIWRRRRRQAAREMRRRKAGGHGGHARAEVVGG